MISPGSWRRRRRKRALPKAMPTQSPPAASTPKRLDFLRSLALVLIEKGLMAIVVAGAVAYFTARIEAMKAREALFNEVTKSRLTVMTKLVTDLLKDKAQCVSDLQGTQNAQFTLGLALAADERPDPALIALMEPLRHVGPPKNIDAETALLPPAIRERSTRLEKEVRRCRLALANLAGCIVESVGAQTLDARRQMLTKCPVVPDNEDYLNHLGRALEGAVTDFFESSTRVPTDWLELFGSGVPVQKGSSPVSESVSPSKPSD